MCLWLALLLHAFAGAQPVNRFHADIGNGLPTNHVYSCMKDHLGYLWIATDNGVLQYNGYTFRQYTVDDGLPNNDVWRFYLDKKNRLWLNSIAHGIGYIRNNRYHPAIVDVRYRNMIYPSCMTEDEQGILFCSIADDDSTWSGRGHSLYLEKNDTIRELPGLRFSGSSISRELLVVDVNETGYQVYRFNKDRRLLPVGKKKPPPSPILKDHFLPMFANWGKWAVGYRMHLNHFWLINLESGEAKMIQPKDERGNPDALLTVSYDKGFFWAYGRQTIYQMDSLGRLINRTPVRELTGNKEQPAHDAVHLWQDRFWGDCLSTRKSGLYLNYRTGNEFRALPGVDLSAYKYIGNTDRHTCCWWRYADHSILFIRDGKVKRCYNQDLFDATQIVPFDSNRSLLLDKTALYWIDNKDYSFTPIPYRWVPGSFNWKSLLFPYSRSLMLIDKSHLYISANNLFKCDFRKDTLYLEGLGKSYYNLVPDSFRHAFWAYYTDRILYHPFNGKEITIYDSTYRKYGISSIEKFTVDPLYGNLLLKDNASLYCIDLNPFRVHSLFASYNLREARMAVQDDKIILAGKFGVLISRIEGRNRFSTPVVYPNVKNSLYVRIEGLATTGSQIILRTDRGGYLLEFPPDSAFGHSIAGQQLYRAVLRYRDSLYDLQALDTLPVLPGENRIGIDFINPYGNGHLTCRYILSGVDTGWRVLSGSEFVLPPLEAGGQYTLSIAAGDDVWNSNTIRFVLYMVPQWWQQPRARLFLWSYSGLIIFMLLLEIVLLTRYFVVRSARKKQFLVSLSLRAVYAQINPHFIFNTLNTALYFIRKKQLDEAAVHVTRFSHLLRAYLHSSRNRYITIGEEITNLNNYIQLQQTRFENVFTYEIRTDDVLPRHTLSIPSLLLQPLVENAINHGLVPKGEDGHLSISFHWNEKEHILTCVIDDNGVGRKYARKIKTHEVQKKESYGSDLIRELIATFNQYEKLNIRIDYLDKQPPLTGTQVTIEIKNPRYEQ